MTPSTLAPAAPGRRARTRTAPPLPQDWRCENCEQPNSGGRRRCTDCGTSRW